MADRRRRRAAPSDDASRADNPFAAPPEGQADQPWQPRRSAGSEGGPGTDQGQSGPDSGNGSGNGNGNGNGSGRSGSGSEPGRDRSGWGSHWSSKQPGRQSGGFGGPGGGGQEGGNGDGAGGQGGGLARGMRWDPTDPTQRHARYSLHTGVWALFFSLFSLPEVALLLGALSLYWGISALRGGKSSSKSGTSGKRGGSGAGATAEDVAGTDRTATEDAPKQVQQVPVVVSPAQAAKSRTTAAVSGLIAASLALAVVVATFTFQQVYSEYFTCTEDALTQSSREDCKDLLPSELRPLLENRSSSASGLQMR